MKKVLILILALSLPFTFAIAKSDYEGSASGYLQVSGEKIDLKYSYSILKSGRNSIILSDRPIPKEALGNYKALVRLSNEDQFKGIEIVHKDQKAVEVFFLDNRLPPEMSVKDPGPFRTTKASGTSGSAEMDDPEFSFGYKAQFSAPLYKPPVEAGRSISTDMSTQEQAKIGLKNAGLDFDEDTFTRKVQDGDAGAVELFLQAGMQPQVHGKHALWAAIAFKHVEVAKALIKAGANVNEPGDYGATMLMSATDSKNIPMIELLIESGADLNQANEYGIGPLASASEQGEKEIVDLLLRSGADVNARSQYGGTALQVAVLRGYTEIVKMLIDAGADVARDRKELLEIAQREKHTDVEKLIREAPARKK